MLDQIKKIMEKGKWITIPALQKRLTDYAMETTISARIRDLRKLGHKVERRSKVGRLYEYRMVS